jgi:O-antigen ligase
VTLRGGRRVAALAALAVIGTGVSIHQFAAREADQAGQYTLADSEDSRYELWRAARAVFDAHPILGIGSRRFSEYAREYAPISHDNRGKVAHNTYLEVAADTGILGTLTFVLMLLTTLRSLSRARLRTATGDGLAETQVAGFVTLGCIIFRATLDAKVYDWSFYYLVVIAIATAALASRSASAVPATAKASPTPALPAGVRPSIYRLR